MTPYDRFDVLTALFPFVDIAHRKPRPVLVLSSARFNDAHSHVVAAMITTGAHSRWPSDLPICGLETAGLRHRSVIRMKLFTLPFSVIAKRIGALAEQDRTTFAGALGPILFPTGG